MSLYAISDLHLAYGINKPMDVFGDRWSNYMERLKEEWQGTVLEDDYVIIPGDISWATYLEQAVDDFKFIDSLPGKKIISKGNHDYWWTTMSKLEKFLKEYEFTTISFMHNNSIKVNGTVICGTRGWKCPGDEEFGSEDRKIFERECQRLELSLKTALTYTGNENIITAMHYPPFNQKGELTRFVEIMGKYGVSKCLYGHLHGHGFKNAVTGLVNGIEFHLVSADYLAFKPLKLRTEL